MFDSAETPLHNVRLEFEKNYPDIDFIPVIGDVRVKERVRMVFENYHPQVVFHAAAYKHVPLMEENPCEAVLVNVTGSRQVADMAVEYGAEKMIMVSTDKAVNPTNVMGCSKRLAEIYVQSLGCAIREGKVQGRTKFITTRFGNVLGSNGSVIPRFKEQIEKGGFILAHWDGTPETEDRIKEDTKATIRCLPFDADEESLTPGKCMVTGKPSARRVLFARAY